MVVKFTEIFFQAIHTKFCAVMNLEIFLRKEMFKFVKLLFAYIYIPALGKLKPYLRMFQKISYIILRDGKLKAFKDIIFNAK